MVQEHILIVDDEEDILSLVEYNMKKHGFQVSCVATREEAIKTTRSLTQELIILDLMLPGVDGLDVCKVLKHDNNTKMIPIVMLTAKGEESDIVRGLEFGADDYITKPFSPNILVARIQAVLRRKQSEPLDQNSIVRIHDLEIHPGRQQVLANGDPVTLTLTVFRILHFLSRRPGWVFTRNQIIDSIHGDTYPVTDRSVDVQIVGLRKKLGDCGSYIETVRGVGYRFRD